MQPLACIVNGGGQDTAEHEIDTLTHLLGSSLISYRLPFLRHTDLSLTRASIVFGSDIMQYSLQATIYSQVSTAIKL